MIKTQDTESEVPLISMNIMDECKLGLNDRSIDIFSKIKIANPKADRFKGKQCAYPAHF